MDGIRRIGVAVIAMGWCGGIRAVACSTSPWVKELHIAEIREDRLRKSRRKRTLSRPRPTTGVYSTTHRLKP